ncbi:uncharacterized protein [Panulirus ornatus]|uniref:uncharacterized protein isoform X1 n=1 Tax=Panulirus ornatus TaxID=150431 RepID=UPI003A8BFE6A
MTSRPNVNPLLFSASSSSAFDGFQAPAVLIPPSQNDAQKDANEIQGTNNLGVQNTSGPTLPAALGVDATSVTGNDNVNSLIQESALGETSAIGAVVTSSLSSPTESRSSSSPTPLHNPASMHSQATTTPQLIPATMTFQYTNPVSAASSDVLNTSSPPVDFFDNLPLSGAPLVEQPPTVLPTSLPFSSLSITSSPSATLPTGLTHTATLPTHPTPSNIAFPSVSPPVPPGTTTPLPAGTPVSQSSTSPLNSSSGPAAAINPHLNNALPFHSPLGLPPTTTLSSGDLPEGPPSTTFTPLPTGTFLVSPSSSTSPIQSSDPYPGPTTIPSLITDSQHHTATLSTSTFSIKPSSTVALGASLGAVPSGPSLLSHITPGLPSSEPSMVSPLMAPPPVGFSSPDEGLGTQDKRGSSALHRPRNKYVVQQPAHSPSPSPSCVMPLQPLRANLGASLPAVQTDSSHFSPSVLHPSHVPLVNENISGNTSEQILASSILSPVSSVPFAATSVDAGLSTVNLEAKSSPISFLPPTTQASETSYPVSSQSAVIPTSFENMASNPVLASSMYHPVIHHWFYAVGRPQIWRPFSFADSFKLEEAYMEDSTELVSTEGGRYDVNIKERTRKAVYWEQTEPGAVRRCSWFKKGSLDAQPLPYEEDVAEHLENEYRDAVITGHWHRQVDLKGGDRIMIHSTRAIIHYGGGSLEGDFPTGVSVNGSQAPLTVKRGTEDFEIDDGEAEKIDHLLFLVHGIGSVCDLRFRAVEECVDDFRKLGQQLLSTHFKQSVDMGAVGRVEILPVSWHKALHGDATGIDEKLKPITLRSIPKLREFTNDTILDVLLFNSPIYCQHIMDTVASELNRLYNLFCKRNPSFGGLVSLGGHSLGSVILFDLLMHQSSNIDNTSDSTLSSPKDDHGDFVRGRVNSITSPVNYVMGGAGTGQPSIICPKLIFRPEAFFLMGSPLAMFITVRGIDTIDRDFQLPTCKRVFNIFHPFDPVAYRLETLIDPNLTSVRPVLIPHHKGRKRMHLELKETIERVGTEFKQKIVDSIQNTWNRLYQFYSGSSTNQNLEQQVDEALASQLYLEDEEGQSVGGGEMRIPVGNLNRGCRIDYVLQEKPYESFNEYIFALQAHVTYWESEDTMLLILKELYGPQGILSDTEINNQQSPVASQPIPDGDSALGSGSASPSSSPLLVANPASLTSADFGATVPQSSDPVPLLATPVPSSSSVPPLLDSGLNVMPQSTAQESPRVIGGRPVVDITSQQVAGMDPTVRPLNKPPVGPPPKIPGGTFVRSSPFRR